MKILATSDWHLGNLFHGNDRLPEHRHFLAWLLERLAAEQPDALLIAGDIFDNGNPSAAAQAAYYRFLATASQKCPKMHIIITAGNHDSANRLEAPRPLLEQHRVDVRGWVRRTWVPATPDVSGHYVIDYDDLMIPIDSADGTEHAVVLAVPYLRSDIITCDSYSQGVNDLLRTLTQRASAKFPGRMLVMMAHMYATGAAIAKDSSERIVVGGQEQVNLEDWGVRPHYLTCGHIHRRQHIWDTDWARYTGSVLPMSFAERNYHHGVDLVTLSAGSRPKVEFLEYHPQHPLVSLPAEGAAKMRELLKLIGQLPDREADALSDHACYLELKFESAAVKADDRATIERALDGKDAIISRLMQVLPQLQVEAMAASDTFASLDDVLNRDPMEALKECFEVINGATLNEHQQQLLAEVVKNVTNDDSEL